MKSKTALHSTFIQQMSYGRKEFEIPSLCDSIYKNTGKVFGWFKTSGDQIVWTTQKLPYQLGRVLYNLAEHSRNQGTSEQAYIRDDHMIKKTSDNNSGLRPLPQVKSLTLALHCKLVHSRVAHSKKMSWRMESDLTPVTGKEEPTQFACYAVLQASMHIIKREIWYLMH